MKCVFVILAMILCGLHPGEASAQARETQAQFLRRFKRTFLNAPRGEEVRAVVRLTCTAEAAASIHAYAGINGDWAHRSVRQSVREMRGFSDGLQYKAGSNEASYHFEIQRN